MASKKKQPNPILEAIQSKVVEKVPGTRNISYSQFSTYQECPHQFYLKYGLGNYLFSSSIHSVFGTSLHETIQNYLNLLFNKSIKASKEFDHATFLQERLAFNYKKEREANEGNEFCTRQELKEFWEDGVAIMKYLIRKQKDLFDTKYCILVANELILNAPILEGNEHIRFLGFIDTVLFDTFNKKIIIYDWKTSTSGWSKYQISDEKKLAQLKLYKHFFSKQFDIPFEDISVSFKILKRKVNSIEINGYDMETPRVSTITPAQAAITVKKAVNSLVEFVNECFEPGGKIKEGYYSQTNTPHACRFCPFNANQELCPR